MRTGYFFQAAILVCIAVSPIEAATIRGTSGKDTITGTPQADMIYGLAGYDKINGAGGNDTIYGGPNYDVLRDGYGNDRIFGEEGDDAIYADFGADYADGGPGNDHFIATGLSTWRPGNAWGQAGGASTLIGGPGNDLFTVIGRGIDAYGGDGDDSFVFYTSADDNGDIALQGAARWTGGPGRDHITIYLSPSPNEPAIFVSIMDYQQGIDTLTIGATGRFNNISEMIALFDVNHDGHLSASGDGLVIVNGDCRATFKKNSQGKIIGLELKLLGQNQIWLQGISDLAS